MSQKEADILYFVSFCIEQYKMYRSMKGSDVMVLFDKQHITEYLYDNYDVLHTQSAAWLMEEIDDYMKEVKQ